MDNESELGINFSAERERRKMAVLLALELEGLGILVDGKLHVVQAGILAFHRRDALCWPHLVIQTETQHATLTNIKAAPLEVAPIDIMNTCVYSVQTGRLPHDSRVFMPNTIEGFDGLAEYELVPFALDPTKLKSAVRDVKILLRAIELNAGINPPINRPNNPRVRSGVVFCMPKQNKAYMAIIDYTGHEYMYGTLEITMVDGVPTLAQLKPSDWDYVTAIASCDPRTIASAGIENIRGFDYEPEKVGVDSRVDSQQKFAALKEAVATNHGLYAESKAENGTIEATLLKDFTVVYEEGSMRLLVACLSAYTGGVPAYHHERLMIIDGWVQMKPKFYPISHKALESGLHDASELVHLSKWNYCEASPEGERWTHFV